jgi:hypothetical protein
MKPEKKTFVLAYTFGPFWSCQVQDSIYDSTTDEPVLSLFLTIQNKKKKDR